VLAGLGCDQFVRKPALAYLAVAVIAVDLIAVSSGRLMNAFPATREPGIEPEHFDGSRELMSRMRELVAEQTPPWRIDTAGDSLSWAMAAPITKVPTANGNDPFSPARVIEARLGFVEKGERWGRYYEVDDLSSPVLDLMNVRYVLSRAPLDPAAVQKAAFVHAGSLPGREVYENPQALPRFFLVSRVSETESLDQAARLLRAPDFDPRSEAIVESGVGPLASEGPAGSVMVTAYSPRRVVLNVDAPASAFLVTSETHYPGWTASLDGALAELFYTNVAFRGMAIPPGRHEVVMEFVPAILWRSAAVSAVAWFVWAIVLWYRGRVSTHALYSL
jgi:hypothetical protein